MVNCVMPHETVQPVSDITSSCEMYANHSRVVRVTLGSCL